MRSLRALSLSFLLTAAAVAQAPYLVGNRDVAWPNTTGQGSASLAARVYYPATVAGSNTPLLARPGGWPAVVFLHGFAIGGTSYGTLAQAWAREGFVVVCNNTATFDNAGQEADGRALFSALVAANGSGPFAGGFDVQRVGLAGHSMGGGNVGNVLAANPGYRCGFALAPVTPRGNNAALVAVPFGIVVGTGDTIAPAATYAQPFYAALTGVAGHKFLYLMNGDCSHTNVAGLFLSGATAVAVFDRAAGVGLGFLRHWLTDSGTALEAAIGPGALAEPRLVSLSQAIEAPQVWAVDVLRVGTTTRLSIAAEPGLGGALAAFALAAPSPTPIGDLRLDAGSVFVAVVGVAGVERRIDGAVGIPNDPGFVGLQIALQAVGSTTSASLWLGGAAAYVVGS